MGEHSEIDFASNTKFAFFRGFWESARKMSDEDRLKFYDALADFAFSGVEPDGSSLVIDIIWPSVKPNVVNSVLDHARGKTGGRPPKGKDKSKLETTGESQRETPAKTPLKTPAETDKDMDRDKDRDTEKEEGEFVPLERTNSPSGASAAPAAADAAPPPRKTKPTCPMCDVEVWKNTQTGKWHCPNCQDAFPKEKVGWRWA